MVESLFGLIPSRSKYILALVARRSPKARLYSAVPMSQVCPST